MSNNKLISVSYINYKRLSKLKRYNSKRRGCIDTYNDVITRLIIFYEKGQILGREILLELGLTPAEDYYDNEPPALASKEAK